MTKTSLVRPSRDGDQFHYLWAARRCLLLLSPNANLKVVTIEGSSPSEADEGARITAGEILIDVAEYYGSETIEEATLVRYIQLKHSTLRTLKDWTPSELKKTLNGFAMRYSAYLQRYPGDLDGKLEFCFISNRSISADFLRVIRDVAAGNSYRHTQNLRKLEQFTSLDGKTLVRFCQLLRFEGAEEGLWDQRNILIQDVGHYLPDADVDAPILLKEL